MKKYLTVIIPTFNRPRRLRRLLEYFSAEGLNCNIVIADSSDDGPSRENEESVASLRIGLNLSLIKFSPEIDPYSKLRSSISDVNTEFVASCADDDFLIPSALSSCVEFLAANPEYSVSQGVNVSFLTEASRKGSSQVEFKMLGITSNESLADESALKRLKGHLINYRPTYYAVQRKAPMLESFNKIDVFSSDFHFGELLQSSLMVIWGKLKRFDQPYDIREAHDGNNSRKIEGWDAIIASEHFSDKLSAFRDCLAKEVVKVDGCSIEVACDGINEAMLCYFGRVLGNYRKKVISRELSKESATAQVDGSGGGVGSIIKTVVNNVGHKFAKDSHDARRSSYENHPDILRIREYVIKYAQSIGEGS